MNVFKKIPPKLDLLLLGTLTVFGAFAIYHWILPQLFVARGNRLLAEKKFDEAIKFYQVVKYLKPSDAGTYYSLGVALQKRGDLDQAIAAFQKATQLDPKNASHYIALGVALNKHGEYDEAMTAFLQADRLNPNNDLIYAYIAGTPSSKKLESIHGWRQVTYCEKAIQLAAGNVLTDEMLNEPIRFCKLYESAGLTPSPRYGKLGDVLKEKGKLDKAIVAYQKDIQFRSDFGEYDDRLANTYRQLGNAMTQRGKLEEAKAAWQKAEQIDLSETCSQTLLNILRERNQLLMNNLMKQQAAKLSDETVAKFEAGIAVCRKAIQIDPSEAYFYKNLGDVLKDTGNLDEAILAYRKAIQLNPNYSDLLYTSLGSALREQGKLEAAIDVYQQGLQREAVRRRDRYNYNRLLDDLLMVSKELGNLEKAVSIYRQVIELEPKDAFVQVLLGEALTEQGKFDEAIEAYRKAIEIETKNSEIKSSESYWKIRNIYRKLGDALKKQGNLDEAILNYRIAIYLTPKDSIVKDASIHNNLGDALQDRGDLDEAIAVYRKAIQIDPKNPETRWRLGTVLQKQGKLNEAIAAYRQVIQLNSKLAAPYEWLGDALKEQGKSDEAAIAYQEAVELLRPLIQLFPKQASHRAVLALILGKQGKFQEAIVEFQQAIALEPNNRGYQEWLEEAQRLLALQKNPQLASAPEHFSNSEQQQVPHSVLRSVVRLVSSGFPGGSVGTGWVVKREKDRAIVVTNRHVVTKKDQKTLKPNLEVEFYSNPPPGQFRRRQPARVLHKTAADDRLDLAVLEVTGVPKDIQPLQVSLEAPPPGLAILTIGHPFNSNPWTVTRGEVYKDSFGLNLPKLPNAKLQLTITTASGNSGSPVLDPLNRVVGVDASSPKSTILKREGANFTATSGSAEPINLVMQRLRDWGI